MQQGVLKFNDICVSLSLTKSELEKNFLNLENQSFENVTIFSLQTISVNIRHFFTNHTVDCNQNCTVNRVIL